MIEYIRFEGINQKFTKKLYEWENRRGIAPESSTITLLQTGISQNKVSDKSDKDDKNLDDYICRIRKLMGVKAFNQEVKKDLNQQAD